MTELSGWNFHAYAGANRGCTGYASRRWAHLGPAAAQCGFTPPEEVCSQFISLSMHRSVCPPCCQQPGRHLIMPAGGRGAWRRRLGGRACGFSKHRCRSRFLGSRCAPYWERLSILSLCHFQPSLAAWLPLARTAREETTELCSFIPWYHVVASAHYEPALIMKFSFKMGNLLPLQSIYHGTLEIKSPSAMSAALKRSTRRRPHRAHRTFG